jgi:chitin deacetylase
MKTSWKMGRAKAIPFVIFFAVVLGVLTFNVASATSVEMKVIGALLIGLWLAMGVAALWIFIPQWDPWLRRTRRELRGKKIVALTFDDGPTEPWTSRVLDILKKHDVRATFFVVGTHAKMFPGVVKRAFDEGHVIGGHSATHRILTFLHPDQRLEEIESSIDIIEGIIGCRPNFFRLPHGFKFPGMYKILSGWNLIPIPWTKGLWDTDMPSSDALMKRFAKEFQPFEVLLLHDGITGDDIDAHRESMIESLPTIIEEYRRRGYTFMTIADLGEAACEECPKR